MPAELKVRLEREANNQGVPLTQLAVYMLNLQLTQLETISKLESRLGRKSVTNLKKRVRKILQKVPDREVPEWDKIE